MICNFLYTSSNYWTSIIWSSKATFNVVLLIYLHICCLFVMYFLSYNLCPFVFCKFMVFHVLWTYDLYVLAGDLVGSFSIPLKQIAAFEGSYSHDDGNKWKWVDLFPPEPKVLFNLFLAFFLANIFCSQGLLITGPDFNQPIVPDLVSNYTLQWCNCLCEHENWHFLTQTWKYTRCTPLGRPHAKLNHCL